MANDIGWKNQFRSDTVAGICPQAFQTLQAANEVSFVPSYGEDDEFSGQTRKQLCQLFDKVPSDSHVFFISSGTVANAMSLASVCQPFDGILCHPLCHLEHDEANATEYLTGGAKLLHVKGPSGKIDPTRVFDFSHRGHGCHSVRPRVISITQATEIGTVYSLENLAELRSIKREMECKLQEILGDKDFRIYLHMDGAHFANAVATLQCEPSELVADVDILFFGIGRLEEWRPIL